MASPRKLRVNADAAKRSGETRSKLTRELIETIGHALETSFYDKSVAEKIGVDRSTFYVWQKRGEADRRAKVDSLHAELVARVALARRVFEDGLLGDIASDLDWRAKAYAVDHRARSRESSLRQAKLRAEIAALRAATTPPAGTVKVVVRVAGEPDRDRAAVGADPAPGRDPRVP